MPLADQEDDGGCPPGRATASSSKLGRKECESPRVKQRAEGSWLGRVPSLASLGIHGQQQSDSNCQLIPWQSLQKTLEVTKKSYSVRTSHSARHYLPSFHFSRSHLQPALKSKSFTNRMEQTSKALAIKKLQTELKEEKQAEIQRCVRAYRLPYCTPLTSRLFSSAGDAKLR